MKIGIDARLIEETGVGRYIQNLISELHTIDSKNTYVVYLRRPQYETFVLPGANWEKRLADVRWHTIAEQIQMPQYFQRDALDLVHIPYHNPPIFYRGKMIVTIHDLTILHFSTGKATTLPFGLYSLKRIGYWAVLQAALRRAAQIIAVSETTKQEIIDHFHVHPARITVTYEGVNAAIQQKTYTMEASPVSYPFFLYVGNAYPHKNIEVLVEAFRLFVSKPQSTPAAKLVLVGKEDFFYRRLRILVKQLHLEDRIIFFGQATDDQLTRLYRHAIALVFPSLMEGFGLPALEALSSDCKVIASNISIFHEILRDHAEYFDPHDTHALVRMLEKAASVTKVTPKKDPSSNAIYARKFSWHKMAQETLGVYENSARI